MSQHSYQDDFDEYDQFDPKEPGRTKQAVAQQLKGETEQRGAYRVYKATYHEFKGILRKVATITGYDNPDYKFLKDGTILAAPPESSDYRSTGHNLFDLGLNLTTYIADLPRREPTPTDDNNARTQDDVVATSSSSTTITLEQIKEGITRHFVVAKQANPEDPNLEAFLQKLIAFCKASPHNLQAVEAHLRAQGSVVL